MEWTDKEPTEPGWYWFSGLDDQFMPKVAHLDSGGEWDSAHDNPGLRINPGDLWWGPIPCPERPPSAHYGATRVEGESRLTKSLPCFWDGDKWVVIGHQPKPKRTFVYRGPAVGWVEVKPAEG